LALVYPRPKTMSNFQRTRGWANAVADARERDDVDSILVSVAVVLAYYFNAAHVGTQHFGHDDAAIGLLVVLHHGDHRAW